MKSKVNALYVHIPFCKNICFYCDFKKFIYDKQRVNDYFQSLFFEIDSLNEKKYQTIYIGGGTPSCIDYEILKDLLKKLSAHLKDNYLEFCIECNVEDINEKLLELLVENKINRISIGVQTFNDKYIKLSNRHHNKQMAIKKINLTAKYLKNISIDLIYAFKDQTYQEIKEDLKIALSLPIMHISYYSLLIEPNTVFYARNVQNVDANIQAKMYQIIYDTLNKNHFKRYEISNFAKYKKYQSFHNKTYWHNENYDAIGLASSGYSNNIRYKNIDNINEYLKKNYKKNEELFLSKEDIMFDEIMLRLRLDEGLNIDKFNKKFNVDFFSKYKQAIFFNKKHRLITINNNIIKTTFKGSLLLNDVLEQFL